MTVIARRSSSHLHVSPVSQLPAADPDWAVSAADRAGPPPVNWRRRRVRRLLMFALVLAGAGWLWQSGHGERVQAVLWSLGSAMWARLEPALQRGPTPPDVSAAEQAALPALEMLVPRVVGPSPGSDQAQGERQQTAAVTPDATAGTAAAAAAHPSGDAAAGSDGDPLRRRAELAGLHPGLSRVLLERLTSEDFRNAEAAIRKAIAETPDGEELNWPRAAPGQLARFRIYFVPGAAENCRRYVVEIAKDRWLTTALPMEKCGVPAPVTRKS